ncbi:MAG: S9 family peptidase, partial [Pseudomonadota bacterium]
MPHFLIRCLFVFTALLALAAVHTAQADDDGLARLTSEDIFKLQWASEVHISPDGERVAYLRAINDIMSDRTRSNLWIVNADGREHRPLVSGPQSISSPRFSPDGNRIAYLADSHNNGEVNTQL